jgi:hypothetical protein
MWANHHPMLLSGKLRLEKLNHWLQKADCIDRSCASREGRKEGGQTGSGGRWLVDSVYSRALVSLWLGLPPLWVFHPVVVWIGAPKILPQIPSFCCSTKSQIVLKYAGLCARGTT